MHVRCARDPFLSGGLSCGHSERKERSKSKRSLLQFIASLHSKVWDKAGRVRAAIPEPGALDRTLWRWAKSGQTARHAAPVARRTCDVVSCGGCARFRAREQLLSSRVFSQARWSLFSFLLFFSPSKVGSASATYASRESAALEGGSFRLDTLDSRVSEIVCLLRREDQSAWVWTSAVCLTCFTALTGRLFSCSSSLSRGHERSRKRGTASPPVRWRTGLVGRSRGLRDPAGAVVK